MKRPIGFDKLQMDKKYIFIEDEKFYFRKLAENWPAWPVKLDNRIFQADENTTNIIWILRDDEFSSSESFGRWIPAIIIHWDTQVYKIVRVPEGDGMNFTTYVSGIFHQSEMKTPELFMDWVHGILTNDSYNLKND